jgi:hypothetical protein
MAVERPCGIRDNITVIDIRPPAVGLNGIQRRLGIAGKLGKFSLGPFYYPSRLSL